MVVVTLRLSRCFVERTALIALLKKSVIHYYQLRIWPALPRTQQKVVSCKFSHKYTLQSDN